MHAEVIQLRPDSQDPGVSPDAFGPAEPQGIHLALSFSQAALDALRANPVLASHALKNPYTRRIEQVFWDTPDHRLGRSGIALALQAAGQKRLQIVQPIREIEAGGRPNGTTETPIQGTRPDLVRLALTAGADPILVSALDPAGLIPVFAIAIRRTSWSLAWGDTRLMLTLDQGSITTSRGDGVVCQAELTHVSGPANGLYDCARSFSRNVPFTLARLLPAQEGYRLITAEDWWPTGGKPALTATMSVRDGVLAIGRAATATLRNEVEMLIGSQKPERIHQTRVAIRRLRSVLSVFGPVLPMLTRRALGQELNALASQLGSAREWDVFLAEILAPMEQALSEERGLPALRLTGAVLREQAASVARLAVADNHGAEHRASAPFMDLSLRLGAWFDAGLWPEPPTVDAQFWLDQPLMTFAQELLGKRHRKLVRIARDLVDPRPDELHALRIEAKKLRYTAEFFARLFPQKSTKRYLTALAEIQDILGVINDAATSRSLVHKLCAGGQPNDIHAAGLISGWMAAQAATSRRHFAESWAAFTAVKRFWKDA